MYLNVHVWRVNLCLSLHYRKKDDNTYEKTTWTIKFKLNNVNKDETFKLRLALASAQVSDLQVFGIR